MGSAGIVRGYAGDTWLEDTEETWVACEEPETSSSSPKGLFPQKTNFSMQERNCERDGERERQRKN